MPIVQLRTRCRVTAFNFFRLQFSMCCTNIRAVRSSHVLRHRSPGVSASGKTHSIIHRENIENYDRNLYQRRYIHDDSGATQRSSTVSVTPSPLSTEVFDRTVQIPSEVHQRLVPAETGTGGIKEYNAVWMRENCRCPQCHTAVTNQRNVVLHHLGTDAFEAVSVTATEDHRLQVLWADGHVSKYDLDWLDKVTRPVGIVGHHTTVSGNSSIPYSRRLWDSSRMSNIDQQLERVDYGDLVDTSPVTLNNVGDWVATEKSRAAAKALLGNLLRHGFAFVDNAPADEESTMAAIHRICPPLRTFYGESWTFGVAADDTHKEEAISTTQAESSTGLEFSDTSYLDVGIGVHTDGTYWSLPPGIQVLHCIRRDHNGTAGGDTLLVDGFHAAERLRQADRTSFDLLTQVRLDHYYVEPGKFEYRSSEAVLRVFNTATNGEGEMEWIRYNPFDRTPIAQVTSGGGRTATQSQVYAALAGLGRLIDDPSAALRFRLTPGRILFVDNWRVLHGRTAFTGPRLVCGCYLSRDDWISKAQSLGLLAPTYT